MKTTTKACLLIIFFFLTACNQLDITQIEPPEAVEGVLDLQDWDFEANGSVNLAGEWAFYWQELLQPEQISSHPSQVNYVPVPDNWSDYEIDGVTLTPEGYATYQLTLYPPDNQQAYGLFNGGQGSAYTLWVDGHLLTQDGQVGINRQDMIPDKQPKVVFFQPSGETVEIVLQISNFHHRKGGFRNSLLLGLAESVHSYQIQNWFVEAFSLGILFIMGLYHLFIYAMRHKNKAPLYFALLCWLMALRIGVTNQHILLSNLPIVSWSTELRVEYFTFFLGAPLFALFIQSLYPKDIHRWFVWGSLGLGIGFTLFMVFTDTLTLSYTPTFYQIVILIEIIYSLFFLGRILVKRRDGAAYIGFASLILFAAVVIETLYYQNLLPFGKVAPYGFLAFIFVQAILLASRFSRSFQRVETLSNELEGKNISLQKSERKYRTIFEDSKDVIFIAGLDERIEDVSPACEAVLGYTKGELQQMNVLDVVVNLEDRARFKNAITEQGSVKDFEVELLRKDGQKIDALVTATVRRDEDGMVTGFQGNMRDITAKKQAEAERLRALKFEQIATTDPLTKTYNRRFFHEAAEKEVERARRSGSPLSLILFDIDHFKEVNDTYGHLAGDQVLINLVNLIQPNLRSMDLFARYGGEEFIILMPDTDKISARRTAERLREMVAEEPMAKSGNSKVTVTISLGIADWNNNGPLEINILLALADQALYQSKKAGRNRTTIWEDELMTAAGS